MTYIGDANDPATILADVDIFFSTNFSDPDQDVRDISGFSPVPCKDPVSTLPDYWTLGMRTSALVQVYDLVGPFDVARAASFLQLLGRIGGALLANRDDMRGFPADPFRGRVMPAWGGFTCDRDGKWNTDVVTSGILVYPMAAFARRVADHPALYPQHQGDAIRFITAVIETYMAFRPELHLVEGDSHAYFKSPLKYKDLQCGDSSTHHACSGYRDGAGKPIDFNENLSMMKALAECALAADSALYRGSPDATLERLRLATEEMPLVIAKNVSFFVDNLTSHTLSDGTPYFGFKQLLSSSDNDDIRHAGSSLGSLAVILECQTGINSLLARAGRAERVPLSPSVGVGSANTFLRKIWRHNVLSDQVDGGGGTPEKDLVECAGWIPLAQFDQWVWRRCRDTTFHRLIDAAGTPTPDLRVDNHGALLRYREFSSNSTKYLTDFAGQNWLITPAPLAAGESRPTSIHDQKWLLVLSGVVIADLKGEDGEWGHQTVSFMPDMAGSDDPTSTSGPLNWAINHYSIPQPAGSPGTQYLIRFSVEEFAPFVAPNAMFNASQSMNCGFAVDVWRPNQFGTGTDVLTNQPVNNIFSGINADLAVREKDAWLYRLGYRITLFGKIVFVATSPALFRRPSFVTA
jgi:hypothetical protein